MRCTSGFQRAPNQCLRRTPLLWRSNPHHADLFPGQGAAEHSGRQREVQPAQKKQRHLCAMQRYKNSRLRQGVGSVVQLCSRQLVRHQASKESETSAGISWANQGTSHQRTTVFAKLFGCRVVDERISIPLAEFEQAVRAGTLHPVLYLTFTIATFDSRLSEYAAQSEVQAIKRDGACARAAWYYTLGEFSVKVTWTDSSIQERSRISWHPSRHAKIIKFETL